MPATKLKKKTKAGTKTKKVAAKKASKKSAKKAGSNGVLAAGVKVLIVNIIPRQMSFETNNDSEPNLDVSPTNPLHMAASALHPIPRVVRTRRSTFPEMAARLGPSTLSCRAATMTTVLAT